jgi:hypothetical protein
VHSSMQSPGTPRSPGPDPYTSIPHTAITPARTVNPCAMSHL